MIEAGTGRYLGIDFSEPMIGLAEQRLERFGDRVELVCGDFLETPIDARFDVVLALGLFDYLPNPGSFARRLYEHCADGGSMVGSFPSWSLIKGPVRKVRYEWIGDCPIFNYTHDGLGAMLQGAGFAGVEIRSPGRSGFLVRARRA